MQEPSTPELKALYIERNKISSQLQACKMMAGDITPETVTTLNQRFESVNKKIAALESTSAGLNPDVSLSELYQIRAGYQRRIKAQQQEVKGAQTLLNQSKDSLKEIDAKIAEIEHAGRTGGMIRIM
jgi:chromosome segregation ATPase